MTVSTDYDSERNELGESLLSEIEEYRRRSPSKQYSKSFIVLPWTLVLLLFLFLVFLSYQDTTGPRQVYDGIFSPAQHVLRRKDIVFTGGFDDPRTKYQGSGPEVNNAWNDLYQFGLNRIPLVAAAQMVNKTTPVPNDPGYFVTELSVFHQLHCLNQIRKRLYTPESELDPGNIMLSMRHIEHCVDLIRQSLMCSADIAPISWTWSEKDQATEPIAAVLHTCRDWDEIVDWSKNNHLSDFDSSVRVEFEFGSQ